MFSFSFCRSNCKVLLEDLWCLSLGELMKAWKVEERRRDGDGNLARLISLARIRGGEAVGGRLICVSIWIKKEIGCHLSISSHNQLRQREEMEKSLWRKECLSDGWWTNCFTQFAPVLFKHHVWEKKPQIYQSIAEYYVKSYKCPQWTAGPVSEADWRNRTEGRCQCGGWCKSQ